MVFPHNGVSIMPGATSMTCDAQHTSNMSAGASRQERKQWHKGMFVLLRVRCVLTTQLTSMPACTAQSQSQHTLMLKGLSSSLSVSVMERIANLVAQYTPATR